MGGRCFCWNLIPGGGGLGEAWKAWEVWAEGCYRSSGCGNAGERAGSTCAIDVEGSSAAHNRRWAAYAMSLGLGVWGLRFRVQVYPAS